MRDHIQQSAYVTCLEICNCLVCDRNAPCKLLLKLPQISFGFCCGFSCSVKVCPQLFIFFLQSAIDDGEGCKLALVVANPGRKTPAPV